jgi:hypothetical protein
MGPSKRFLPSTLRLRFRKQISEISRSFSATHLTHRDISSAETLLLDKNYKVYIFTADFSFLPHR